MGKAAIGGWPVYRRVYQNPPIEEAVCTFRDPIY